MTRFNYYDAMDCDSKFALESSIPYMRNALKFLSL